MKLANSLFLLSLTLIANSAHATSFTDPVDSQLDMGDYLAENAYGFLPVPILITEPAVGFGGGMMGVFLHESEARRISVKN